MFDKIYSNDNSENLRIFDDIERRKHFSSYSIELNRLFGDKSYDNFYKNLIEHKRARCSNFISIFQKPKNAAGMKICEEPFNIASFEEALNNMKVKSENKKFKISNPYKSRPHIKSITREKTEKLLNDLKKKKLEKKYKNTIKLQKKNIYLPDVPDVGRYNPSYDVLRKHTYQASFSTSTFYDYNKNCDQFNDRNLFVKINDMDYNNSNYSPNINSIKIKKLNININDINNMSQTVNQNTNKNLKIGKIKSKKLYLSTSPLFNSRNLKNKNINKNNLNELNNISNNLSDSKILIRTNGDIHSRCQHKLHNLYNTSSNFSFDDSKLNNSGLFNNSNAYTIKNLKKNHCLKFDNYSKRKPIIYKMNYTLEHFTNPNAFNKNYPVRNKNACIEFNKISTAKNKQKNYFEVEANKNKNPPIGAYNPKFDFTFGRVTNNIFLNKKKNSTTKKAKLKKIMFNYNVPTKYILFHSLNNNK